MLSPYVLQRKLFSGVVAKICVDIKIRVFETSAEYSDQILVLDQDNEDEMVRACSRNGEKTNEYTLYVGKPEGKIRLGRPRRRWVDNIKIDLREREGMGLYGLD
jgi:hypothetical protein